MVSCFAYGDTVLVERFVDGVELALSVVDLGDGPPALPGGRDRPPVGRLRLHRPVHPGPDRVPRAGPRARTTSPPAPPPGRQVHEALGLADLLAHRRDRLARRRGPLPRGERVPGLTETSMFPMAVEAAGHELGEVLARLLAAAAAP
jgi:D-alanine-D-alanine ligase